MGRGFLLYFIYTFFTIFYFKVQKLGLQRAYMDDDSVYKYIRKLMALPFLPYPEIQPMFDLLEEHK